MNRNHKLISITALSLLAALALVACAGRAAKPAATSASTTTGETSSLYLDVHDLGPGNVTAAAVAEAHQKDLAVEGERGVDFQKYWVDEAQGKVYCLAKAPSAEAVTETHREAHGLVPDRVYAVTGGTEEPARGDHGLFLDVHHLGPGKVTAEAVAEAHAKDLAVEGDYGVRFLQYWVDEASGTVVCLSQAPDAAAVNATHGAAHGLLADEVMEVTQGE